jgi:ParB family transcriptional regulator, chromosome partitioning protein
VSEKPAAGNQLRRGGLGRGLASLIPATSSPTASETSSVAIDAVRPNPFQPRTEWDEERLQELAESIRTHGLIQPLIVSVGREAETYILIAGERRLRAARLAGLSTVPVVVKDVAPQALLELALVENLVRADLSPLEEAQAYRQLIEEFGLTQAAVAERVGRSRVSVTNTLRLLNAPDEIKAALASGQITEGHARALLALPTAIDQISVLDDVVAKSLSVRQTEELVRKWSTKHEPTAKHPRSDNRLSWQHADRLQRALQTKVAVKRDATTGQGSITIHFFDDEQLSSLLDRLAGEEHF